MSLETFVAERITAYEATLLVLSVVGVIVTSINEINALRTADWLVNSRLNGPRRITVFGSVIRNFLYLLVQIVFLFISATQMLTITLDIEVVPPGSGAGLLVSVVPIMRLAAQVVLIIASELSRRERIVLLHAIDIEEEHLLRTGTIPSGAGEGVVQAATSAVRDIATSSTPTGGKAIDPLEDREAAADRAPARDPVVKEE